MATSSVTDKQYRALVAELKKHPGNSERHYAETTGIALPQIGSVLYKAELEADPSLKIAKTAKAVAQARSKGLRWPRIAAYSGLSQAKVKELYTEATGEDPSKSWTGRGRRFDGEGKPAKTGSSGRRGAAAKKQGNTGTSGRRGAAASGKRGAQATRGRRGQRAGANPK
jgi:hypothetical protein